MSRLQPWRRKCPDVVTQRIQQCLDMRMLLVSSTGACIFLFSRYMRLCAVSKQSLSLMRPLSFAGPTGFVIKEDEQQRTFTVLLGDMQRWV